VKQPCGHVRWQELPRHGPRAADGAELEPVILWCLDCDAWGRRPPAVLRARAEELARYELERDPTLAAEERARLGRSP